jgi:hypothetical protein
VVGRRTPFVASLAIALACLVPAAASVQAPAAQPRPALTTDEMRRFLLTAKVLSAKRTSKGINEAYRLTLSDGVLTHDAGFNSVDRRKQSMEFQKGQAELNFVDSYHYNIAAYGLAELLGLESMTPVVVERSWQGRKGAVSWWVDAKWDEQDRRKLALKPPDSEAWARQNSRMWVFAALVHDTDRNQGNILITEDWKLWMIDFTRAFRLWNALANPSHLQRCDRLLLDRLRTLTAAAIKERTDPHLSEWEIKAVLDRRDLLIAHFAKLIAERGEANVLF